MEASPEPGPLSRDQIVEATARQLEAAAYRVSARDGLGGRSSPVPTNGHVPDVRGRRVDQPAILVAVETEESLNTSESSVRWKAFGQGVGRLEVACPASIVQEARELGPGRTVVTILADTGERYLDYPI